MERQGTAVSRRNFLKGGIGPMPTGIRPPGVEEAALVACTGCGACVADCPSHIIRLVDRLPLHLPQGQGLFDHDVLLLFDLQFADVARFAQGFVAAQGFPRERDLFLAQAGSSQGLSSSSAGL